MQGFEGLWRALEDFGGLWRALKGFGGLVKGLWGLVGTSKGFKYIMGASALRVFKDFHRVFGQKTMVFIVFMAKRPWFSSGCGPKTLGFHGFWPVPQRHNKAHPLVPNENM